MDAMQRYEVYNAVVDAENVPTNTVAYLVSLAEKAVACYPLYPPVWGIYGRILSQGGDEHIARAAVAWRREHDLASITGGCMLTSSCANMLFALELLPLPNHSADDRLNARWTFCDSDAVRKALARKNDTDYSLVAYHVLVVRLEWTSSNAQRLSNRACHKVREVLQSAADSFFKAPGDREAAIESLREELAHTITLLDQHAQHIDQEHIDQTAVKIAKAALHRRNARRRPARRPQ